MCLLCVFVMTVMNLRGVKESGKAFAGPTYFYIAMLIILIATGLYRIFVEHVGPIPDDVLSEELERSATVQMQLGLLMLSAGVLVSGGCCLRASERCPTRPGFKKPEGKNAAPR